MSDQHSMDGFTSRPPQQHGWVAQLVEQPPEERRVAGSIPALTTTTVCSEETIPEHRDDA